MKNGFIYEEGLLVSKASPCHLDGRRGLKDILTNKHTKYTLSRASGKQLALGAPTFEVFEPMNPEP
jgi:hypothetical protein